MASRQLVFDILANNKTGPGIRGAETDIQRLNRQWDQFKKAAVVASTAVVAGIAAFGVSAVKAGEAASTSNARINNVADSMGVFGDNVGDVSDRLIELAEVTARATGVDQNSIKATQAKLLTFSELAETADTAGGSFDRATQAAIDLAAAGFGSAEENAVQLGKALQDPITGLTALRRNGITFTEAEQDVIKAMVEAGDAAGAQALILEAVEKQVGGTAEATANASDKMSVGFSLLQEKLGTALLPTFERFTDVVVDLTDWMGEHEGVVLGVIGVVGTLAATILAVTIAQKAWTAAQVIWTGVTTVATAVQKGLNTALKSNPIGLVITVIGLLVAAVIKAYQESETFRNVVDKALDGIYSAWQWLWNNGIAPVIRFILNGFANIVQGIANMLRALGNIPGFGWAKDAADKMDNAADKARAMASGINNIPDHKSVTIAMRVERGQLDAAMRDYRSLGVMGAFASGGYVDRTGAYLVGEKGAEIVQLPAGARVFNAQETAGMQLDSRFGAAGFAGTSESAGGGPIDLSDSTIQRLAAAMLAGAGAVTGGALTRERLASQLAGRPVY